MNTDQQNAALLRLHIANMLKADGVGPAGDTDETFNSEINPLLERIQGSSEYEGTIPSRGTNVFKAKYEVKQLRRQLDTAIQAENFEEAAILRDKIKNLEVIIDGDNE